MQGMRERVRQLNGSFEIKSGPGGTTVSSTAHRLALMTKAHPSLRDAIPSAVSDIRRDRPL